mgnify:CR=1 FL=1
MEQINYDEGICCPDDYDDDKALMEFVIREDCELCYLDTFLRETLGEADGA